MGVFEVAIHVDLKKDVLVCRETFCTETEALWAMSVFTPQA